MRKFPFTPKSTKRLATVLIGAALATGTASGVALADSSVNHQPAKTPLELKAASLPQVTAKQLIDLATAQVGIKENSSGGGTKFQQWYASSERARETLARDGGGTPSAYVNAPWCNMFVSWVGDQLGIRPTVGWDAYTVAHAKWFQKNQHWGSKAEPGAVVFFAWGGGGVEGIDHVGFVVKDNGDSTITTVEGNTGNGAVEIRQRNKSDVAGYGYPVYAKA
ncbi:Cell wall-associated hydrolase, NlpC family [Sinosporangium album]|uniref:Cell wall-associated hydrolase, NlpC family n=1 Tax=Sinosporangium album TaxID=504805 RepID=A0A1G8DX82_9ACTN|nr:CHAP domain-containing protein [Sinosporangium album]SDH62274.1 Cell wall-associated hydrolase, NlpC family [Sinosporangium album]